MALPFFTVTVRSWLPTLIRTVPSGRYRVRCQYAGGTLVVAGKVRDWVRVPGKGPNA